MVSKQKTTSLSPKPPVHKASTPAGHTVRGRKKPELSHDQPTPSATPTGQYWYGLGRRKEAVAKLRLFQGVGTRTVNGKPFEEYFPLESQREVILAPLAAIGMKESAGLIFTIRGGGMRGQMDAARLAIARALVMLDEGFKKTLRAHGFMTRDPRVKERKKYGLKRARRAPQWSKR